MFGYDLPSIMEGFSPRFLKALHSGPADSMADITLAALFHGYKSTQSIAPGHPLPPVSIADFLTKHSDKLPLKNEIYYNSTEEGMPSRRLHVFQDKSCLISRTEVLNEKRHYLFLPVSFFLSRPYSSLSDAEKDNVATEAATWDQLRPNFPSVRGLLPANGKAQTTPAWADHHAPQPHHIIMLSNVMQEIAEAIAPAMRHFTKAPGGRSFYLTLCGGKILCDGSITPPHITSNYATPESDQVLKKASRIFLRPDFPLQTQDFVSQTFHSSMMTRKSSPYFQSLVEIAQTLPESATAHEALAVHTQLNEWTSPNGSLPQSASLPDQSGSDAEPVRIKVFRPSTRG